MHVTSPTTGTNVHAAHAVNDFRSLDNNGVLIFAYARHIHFSASQSSTHPHWHYKCNNTEGEGWMDDMQAEEPTAANNNQPKWQSRSKMRSKRNGDNEWGWRVLQSIFSPSRFACTPLFDERHPVWWWGVHYVTVPRIYIYHISHGILTHTLPLSILFSSNSAHRNRAALGRCIHIHIKWANSVQRRVCLSHIFCCCFQWMHSAPTDAVTLSLVACVPSCHLIFCLHF